MKIYCVAIMIAALFFSCKPILLKMKGVRSPKIETKHTLATYLHKSKIDTTFIFGLKGLKRLAEFSKTSDIPDAAFFNRKGYYIEYRDSAKACNAGVATFVLKLPQMEPTRLDSSKNIQTQLDRLVNLSQAGDTNRVLSLGTLPASLQNADYYAIFYWSKWTGKVSSEHLQEWEKAVKNAQKLGIRVQIISVSCDYLSIWGIAESDLPALKTK